jgi:hypothetical protein
MLRIILTGVALVVIFIAASACVQKEPPEDPAAAEGGDADGSYTEAEEGRFSFFFDRQRSMAEPVSCLEVESRDGVTSFGAVLAYTEEAQVALEDDSLVRQLRELVDRYDLTSWGGFHKSNSNVLDGESFRFGLVMDGRAYSASGSNAFPEHYREASEAILELLMPYAALLDDEGDAEDGEDTEDGPQ